MRSKLHVTGGGLNPSRVSHVDGVGAGRDGLRRRRKATGQGGQPCSHGGAGLVLPYDTLMVLTELYTDSPNAQIGSRSHVCLLSTRFIAFDGHGTCDTACVGRCSRRPMSRCTLQQKWPTP
ncbi:hypothetical protein PR202_gb02303 [Eleusine coracana subsp. coracana]|uniref:Uncharacterized protein n=1 Tax=Eleusine coracana subsp. coracana TaxID=191504 RepID=A0AAV5DY92_ELECO|nr:hypothetical protein PR202_gb02303 [Eleusine coracana subsp. coracana]